MTQLAQLSTNARASASAGAELHRIPRSQTLYYAFLSYSHRDEQMATWIQQELEQFRVPRALAGRLTENGVIPKRLAPIFRDRHELAAADDLSEEIEAALSCSQFLVVLCSPESARSRWTNAEIEYFKRRRPNGCVLAAIVAGEPFASELPGREAEECFPPALLQKYDRRGRPTGRRAEPLAADLRGDSDDRRLGLLKLIAGMLGVGLDELVQRETTQRHRKFAWLAAASLAGMAITSGLAITAIQSRDEARDQRREAEGLVAFMLGDLKDKLEPIGRLDALDGVGARVLAYYSKQDASELSNAALLQRSRALSLTAQVAYQRGNVAQAERLYGQALTGTAEGLRRSPDDPERLFDHAQNVFWIGELARKRGAIGQAEAAFREYKRLADRMVALQPDNLKWRMELAYARSNLGIALFLQRRFAEAERLFAESIAASSSLAAIDPSNTEYSRATANQLAWLADAQAALGQLDRAIATRQQQIALLARLAREQGADVRVSEYRVPALQGLGLLLLVRDQPEAGAGQLRLAVEEAERLMRLEPDSATWKGLAAAAQLELGKTLLAMGRVQEASREIRAGCGLTADYLARTSNVARSATLRTSCLTSRARLALATGANVEALTLAERALASARSERSGDWITDPRYSVAAAYRLIGDIQQRTGDAKAANAAWSAGLAQLPENFTERPREMSERVELLKRLRRTDQAQPLVDRLAAIGFKAA